jgi:hypothetical protein
MHPKRTPLRSDRHPPQTLSDYRASVVFIIATRGKKKPDHSGPAAQTLADSSPNVI